MTHLHDYPYLWRCKTRLGRYFGQPCRVLARGSMNSCRVEFPDGYRAITSRNFIRRRHPVKQAEQ